jgi:hypothetical protein
VGVTRPQANTAVFSAPGIDYGALRFTFSDLRSVDID